ncbi:MAG TPA: ABC transporter permease [Vicinamibacterales bacterium]
MAIHDAIDAPLEVPRLQRPSWWLSVALDALLAIGSYLAAYWLRFSAEEITTFLPSAWATMTIVVVAQLSVVALVRGYAPRPRVDWLVRVVGGVIFGTVAAGVLVAVIAGFEGVSRLAFVADAILLSTMAVGWRGVWVLRRRAQASVEILNQDFDLIDRAEEMTTVGSVIASLYSYRELLKNLVLKDLKLKYRGSVFGFLWSLANPLLMVVVYTIAFTFILRIRTAGFVYYLMLGQLAWTYFAGSALMSTGAIVDNGGLVKSVRFPRAILPIGAVLFNLVQYALTTAVILPAMMLWYRAAPAPSMLLFPVMLALQTLFSVGVALILATATAFFRDVRHLLEIALSVLFWTTPIVYRLSDVPEGLRLLILLSPMSPYVVGYQTMFFSREWPAASIWLVAATHALGAFVVGALLFLAFEDRFTEQV